VKLLGPGVPIAADAGGARHGTIDELAAAERIKDTYVSRVLRPTLLTPGMMEEIPRFVSEFQPRLTSEIQSIVEDTGEQLAFSQEASVSPLARG
jgi:hypothetical protein